MKKLFKLLSLLRLFKELRYAMRSHGGHYRPHGYRSHGYGPHDPRYRSRDFYPLYRRHRKPKLKWLVRDLLEGRRY